MIETFTDRTRWTVNDRGVSIDRIDGSSLPRSESYFPFHVRPFQPGSRAIRVHYREILNYYVRVGISIGVVNNNYVLIRDAKFPLNHALSS